MQPEHRSLKAFQTLPNNPIWFAQALPAQVIIESDAFIASIAAIGVDPGILLIAGTGSIVIGRDKDRAMFRIGGWGPHFGDEGSGFWIGREAVRAALRSIDVQN